MDKSLNRKCLLVLLTLSVSLSSGEIADIRMVQLEI